MITKITWAVMPTIDILNDFYICTGSILETALIEKYSINMSDILSVNGLAPTQAKYTYSTTPTVDGATFNGGRSEQRFVTLSFILKGDIITKCNEINSKLLPHTEGCLIAETYDGTNTKKYYLWKTRIETVDYNVFSEQAICTVDFISDNAYFSGEAILYDIEFEGSVIFTNIELAPTQNPKGTGFSLNLTLIDGVTGGYSPPKVTTAEALTSPPLNTTYIRVETTDYTIGTDTMTELTLCIDSVNKRVIRRGTAPSLGHRPNATMINRITTGFGFAKVYPDKQFLSIHRLGRGTVQDPYPVFIKTTGLSALYSNQIIYRPDYAGVN